MFWIVAVGLLGFVIAVTGLVSWSGYEAPPKPGEASTPKKVKTASERALDKSLGRLLLLIGVVLMAVTFAWYKLYYQSEGQIKERQAEEARKACHDETMAYVMSQNFVKRTLKAPASASFPSITEVASEAIGDCKFEVVAYVDAQNSFGAKIRNYYSAEMEYFPDRKTWAASRLKIHP